MTAAAEISRYFVTPVWVARHYGISRQAVYRAILSGKLQAVEIRNDGGRCAWVLDVRKLPASLSD